jgi:hypothetical protein
VHPLYSIDLAKLCLVEGGCLAFQIPISDTITRNHINHPISILVIGVANQLEIFLLDLGIHRSGLPMFLDHEHFIGHELRSVLAQGIGGLGQPIKLPFLGRQVGFHFTRGVSRYLRLIQAVVIRSMIDIRIGVTVIWSIYLYLRTVSNGCVESSWLLLGNLFYNPFTVNSFNRLLGRLLLEQHLVFEDFFVIFGVHQIVNVFYFRLEPVLV